MEALKTLALLGAFIGCAGYGWIRYYQLLQRCKQLKEWQDILMQLRTKMCHYSLTITRAFHEVASTDTVAGKIICSAEKSMRNEPGLSPEIAIAQAIEDQTIALKKQEIGAIRRVFSEIHLDRASVGQAIEMAENELAKIQTVAQKEANEKGKLWRTFGVLSGLAIVIIFI